MKVLKLTAVLLLAVGMFSTAAMANAPEDNCATTTLTAPGLIDPCNDKAPTGPLGGCTSGGGLLDQWMSFIAPATSTRIRTDIGSTGTDSDYIVWTACGGTKIGCSEDEAPPYLGNICVGGLTAGGTYYLQVGSWADNCPNGPYNVTIAAAGTCGDSVVDCGEECDPPGPCCSATCLNAQTCGDNVKCGSEACDGSDDAACPGLCSANCTCNLPRCGDNLVNQTSEECDGTGVPLCADGSFCATNCLCVDGIPAVSEWGLAVLTLIGLVSGTILFGRRRVAVR